jgi:predicted NBD/HSP70 family sugar kinase
MVVENDVNLAALGEQRLGRAQGAEHFAYIHVGLGLGAGVVLDGQLHRGARGAGGEIAFAPLGSTEDEVSWIDRGGAAQANLSGAAIGVLVEQLRPDISTASPLATSPIPEEVFSAARGGDPLARAAVSALAARIGMLVAMLQAFADLELIVLGGAVIANNEDLLLAEVGATVARYSPYPPEIVASALGDDATVAGAIGVAATVAAERALARLRPPSSTGGLP